MKRHFVLLLYIALCSPALLSAQETPPADTSRKPEILKEAVITSFIPSRPKSTQTGLKRIDSRTLNSGFAFLSSPDIIKTLQMMPGVASGTELISGLYVHGGIGSDNLFTLDGVPIYQVSHLAGLFSSFNTDITETVDFYKSGFPARYGGKLSSVVDIRTKDEDFEEYHGSFSIGLIDGRISYGGPIVKGKTSFNLSLRGSWLDVISLPAVAIANASYPDEKIFTRYGFWDGNARITHKFSQDNRLSFNFYMGRDALNFNIKSFFNSDDGDNRSGYQKIGNNVNWGNILTSLNWKNRITPELYSDISLWWSNYRGMMAFSTETGGDLGEYSEDNRNFSRINDAALNAGFDWLPHRMHHIRFGVLVQQHWFTPAREIVVPSSSQVIRNRYDAFEPAVYIEDEISPAKWFSANAGLRYSAFLTGKKTWHHIEPRVAMEFRFGSLASLKASYTEMNQAIHQVATTYLDLPSNLWLPATEKMRPMHSKQVAGGVYFTLPHGVALTLEGWWKTFEHLYEYVGANSFYPPVDQWETSFAEGRGRSWGLELEADWRTEKVDLMFAYTLSWNMRHFEEIYHTWYPDRNDSRHKITVTANYRFSKHFDCYIGWNWRTGSRMTVESYVIPGSNADYTQDQYLYFAPNNVLMPDYHRLDMGMNFRKATKRGNERIWNISIYNVYCRMNPFMAYVTNDENGNTVGEAVGVIPIIPSFSYTLKF